MPIDPSTEPGSPDATDAVPDPSRRGFLAGFGALIATAGLALLPRGASAQWWGEPPPLDRPSVYDRSRRYNRPRRYDRPSQYDGPGWQNRGTPFGRSYDPTPISNDLGTTIQRYITRQRQAGRLASNERSAWLVYDFTTGRYLAAINASAPYQSASMIKPFIALAFFHKVQDGELSYTPYHRWRMEAMIQRSDNRATNYFIELLNRTSSRSGPAEAQHTLKRRNPGIFRHTRIVERIPRGGRSYRNKASALDYSRFLEALWYDRLPYSMEIKRLMNLPNRDRVYTGARGVPRGTLVLDKTGTTARLCGDMGILIAQGQDGRRYPYTFIGIIEKARPAGNFTAWKNSRGDVIREVSSIAYRHLRQMHDLV